MSGCIMPFWKVYPSKFFGKRKVLLVITDCNSLKNFAHTKRVDVGGYSLVIAQEEITSTDNSLNRD